MDCSIYRKLLESHEEVDIDKMKKLLKIYLQVPSLPALQAVRASLVELKTALGRQDTSAAFYPKTVRRLLCENRLGHRRA